MGDEWNLRVVNMGVSIIEENEVERVVENVGINLIQNG